MRDGPHDAGGISEFEVDRIRKATEDDLAQCAARGRFDSNARKLARGYKNENPLYFVLKFLAKSWQRPLVPSHRSSKLVEGGPVKLDAWAHRGLRDSPSCSLAASQSIS